MSLWEAITWNTARAGGFTAYLLVTISVLLGLALSMRWQVRWWPRLISYELHVWITNLSFVFLGIHIFASWIDPFTRFGLNELLLPFVSHCRPLWMALGIVAMYLSLAVTLSLFIRRQIGYTWWLRLHELSFVVWALATVHGLATGSDTRTLWGIELYIVSAVLVCGLLCVRLLQPVTPSGKIHPVWAAHRSPSPSSGRLRDHSALAGTTSRITATGRVGSFRRREAPLPQPRRRPMPPAPRHSASHLPPRCKAV
jgi:predicted ferric reductase